MADESHRKYPVGRIAGTDEYMVVSIPPVGCCAVYNIYWDPVAKKIVVDYDDVPKGG